MIGSRVRVTGAYTAVVVEVGTIPDTCVCVANRGLPGYRVQWERLDEATGRPTRDLEPLEHESRSWVRQDHCQPAD